MQSVQSSEQKIRTIILQLLPDVSDEEVAQDTDIFSLGLDSINAMSLILDLQKAFNIKFETSEINFENFQTIAHILQLMQKK